MQNGETDVSVYSVIAHETATGYAQCFAEDVDNVQMGELRLGDFDFSDQVKAEWTDPLMYDKLIKGWNVYEPIGWVTSDPMNNTIILKTESDTQALAQQLAAMNLSGSVWLSGDLGAGKTTRGSSLLVTSHGAYRGG